MYVFSFVLLVETSDMLNRSDIIHVPICYRNSNYYYRIWHFTRYMTPWSMYWLWLGMLTPPDTRSYRSLRLACVVMSGQVSSKLVLFPDVWVSNIPRYCYDALFIKHERLHTKRKGPHWSARIESTSVLQPSIQSVNEVKYKDRQL